MKWIATILFFFLCFIANATIYYVDASRPDDTGNGLTTGTAWKTIAKVNASSFSPGDQILFKKDGVWNERLLPPNSGSAGNVITFGTYSSGNKPLITGFQALVLADQGSNIWSATATNSVKQLNTVMVNGAFVAKARTPNSGYTTVISYSGNTQITTAETGNHAGYHIVFRTAHWVLDGVDISSQAGGVFTLSPGLTYTPQYGGNGWFYQNNTADLDVVGEYTYDSTTKVLKVYATSSPTVQISTIDTLVWLRSKDYITFDGISFTGANKAAFQLDTASHITIQNCAINYSGTNAISGKKSSYCTVTKDSLQNSFNAHVYMRQVDPYTPTVNTCDYFLMDSCYTKNAGHKAGMGLNDNGRYNSVYVVGLQPVFTNNVIDSSGYCGLLMNGFKGYIHHNLITNFCFVKDDGGGTGSGVGAYFPVDYDDSTIISANILINGIGATPGTTLPDNAAGLHVDDGARRVTMDSNTIYNCLAAGFKTYNVADINVRYNTVVNGIGYPLHIMNVATNLNFKNNIFYCSSTSWNVLYRDDGTTVATMDSNYYSRPLDETNIFKRQTTGLSYTLAAWQTLTGQEAHSQGTPPYVTAAAPLFYYNASLSPVVQSLSGLYYDMRQQSYNNSVTIAPYSSVLLFKSINEVPGPGGSGRIGTLIFH